MGTESQNDACQLPAKCPYWAQWENWGACSETCRTGIHDPLTGNCTATGIAQKTRSRDCLFGDIGGQNCPVNDATEISGCDDSVPFCCVYDNWQAWETCQTEAGKT